MSVVLQGTLPFTCGLFYSLNVYENVAFALRARTRWSPERIDEVTLAHLGMVGLRDRANDMPDQLSAGMCKRTALARALALEARIVIIDDFDSGIDGVRLALLCELIRDAAAQHRRHLPRLDPRHDGGAQARRPRGRDPTRAASSPAATPTRSSARTSPLVHQLIAGELSGPLQLGAR